MLKNLVFIATGCSGAAAVLLGALSAHSLAAYLSEHGRTATFATANLYHFVHTLALLGVAILLYHLEHKMILLEQVVDWAQAEPRGQNPTIVLRMMKVTVFQQKQLAWAALFFLGGLVFFSGSLYLLSLTQWKFLGAIAPLGGVFFIIAWGLIGYAFWTS